MGSSGLAAWHAHARLNIGDQFRGDAALVHRLRVVTRNVADFQPMGVELIDPWG